VDTVQKGYKVSGRRVKEEVDTEPNIAPMMNLMVILIPLLLSSAEFIKIGAIELKLPETAQGGGGSGDQAGDEKKVAKLDLGVVVTARGFDLFHHFKENQQEPQQQQGPRKAEIPKQGEEYDFKALNARLAEVKRQALIEILRSVHPSVPDNATLIQLYRKYSQGDYSSIEAFRDHENVKIVAEDTIKYRTVVGVMDAARGASSSYGTVTMFPQVSIAGGIIQ
jgi:biopolymer transport protein ExbD